MRLEFVMKPLLLAALAAISFGCDAVKDLVTESDMGPTEVILEVDDEETIGDLDEMEQTAVCDALINNIESRVPAENKCVVLGVANAVSEASGGELNVDDCTEFQTVCTSAVQIGSEAAPDLTIGECGLFGGDVADCDTTIGELRACLNLMADAAVSGISDFLTCGLIEVSGGAVPDLSLPGPEVPEGAEECAQVRLACPGVFSSDGAGGMGGEGGMGGMGGGM